MRRLTEAWQEEHERWQQRDLSARRYVYVWADGVYFTPRLEHDRQCMLVLIGADASGRKELLAIEDGFRESAQSWRELLPPVASPWSRRPSPCGTRCISVASWTPCATAARPCQMYEAYYAIYHPVTKERIPRFRFKLNK